MSGGLRELAALQQEVAKLVLSAAVVRRKLYRAAQVLERLRPVASGHERRAEIAVRVRGVGAAFERLAEGLGGLGVPVLAKQGDADDVVNRVGVGEDRTKVSAAEDSLPRDPHRHGRRLVYRRAIRLVEKREVGGEPRGCR